MHAIDVARTYLDALLSHDADAVRVAPGVRRIDNGAVTVEGADALRAIVRREPAAATGRFRWVVDGDDAVAMYDLDADLSRTADSDGLAPPETWIPAFICERFHVVDGLLTEIEVVYAAGAAGTPRPERPSRYPAATPPRQQVIDVATTYLDALVSHDGTAVPFAEHAWRVENGRATGEGADGLVAALALPVMDTVVGVTDVRWWVEGDTAFAFYELHVDTGRYPGMLAGSGERQQLPVAERFRVHDGRLAEVEAVFPNARR